MHSKKERFLGLYEPGTSWTDFLISIEALIFALLLIRKTELQFINLVTIGILMCISMASFLGGVSHGFFKTEESRAYRFVWKSTLAALVVNGALILVCVWTLFSEFKGSPNIKITVAAMYSSLGIYWAIKKKSEFSIALLFYMPPTLGLFILLIYQRSVWGLWGVGLTLLAGFVQWRKFSIHKKIFDYNFLYHSIQAFGLYFVYLWAKNL